MCVTPSLAEKRKRVFVRRLFLADAACSPCLPYPTNVYVTIWCCKQITSKRHVHRPTVLNSLSAGDGRLHRIVLIFCCPRTITDISVIRLSLMWCVPATTTRHGPVSMLRLPTVFRPCCCSCTCASLGTSFLARGRMGPPLCALEQQHARVGSRTTRSHNERSTARFSQT